MKKLELNSDWESYDYSKLHVDEKSACVVRYGAFGDLIQASSIFPALKSAGYHVTVNITDYGADIIRNDPNVDCVFIQKRDFVPNEKLSEYWGMLSKQFDKFINLSESVERSLLALEGDKQYNWAHDFRNLVMSVDYLDGVHAIAGVLGSQKQPRFYPSNAEKQWAINYRKKLGLKNKIILWSLSGSSVHKYWPNMDQSIATILIMHPKAKIVMVGDDACRIIEEAWKNETRIIRKSGRWSIRESLSFMKECDIIVGPETGLMNAASFEPMKKILLLSHSSKENLGGSWLNTSVMEPKDTECYPCHKMHYGWKTCWYDEISGGAMCQANISAEDVYREIRNSL